jgi:hypothetical protein
LRVVRVHILVRLVIVLTLWTKAARREVSGSKIGIHVNLHSSLFMRPVTIRAATNRQDKEIEYNINSEFIPTSSVLFCVRVVEIAHANVRRI